jgi:Protein of unknown function (DUF4230)
MGGRLARLVALGLFGVAVGFGAVLAVRLLFRGRAAPPPTTVVVERVREVARLEVLDVALYRKVEFAPDPVAADSIWGDLWNWARRSLRSPHGKAIVFADAHLGLDLSKLGEGNLRVRGRTAFLLLPPLKVSVELKPAETEVVGSNLDSAETAELFELARAGFEREVQANAKLRERALGSARRALTGLFASLGFDEVHFVEELPALTGS